MTVVLSWSGGKDCAMALWRMRQEGIEPVALLTTVDEDSGAVAHHGVPAPLLRLQAEAAGVPLVAIPVPRGASNEVYEARLRAAFAEPPLLGVEAVAFGDLFLEDIRAYREQRLAEAGIAAMFPLWGHDTSALAQEVVAAGFTATLVSVDRRVLGIEYLGRSYDRALLGDLPAGVDPCGENGEFHTFVHAGPVFRTAVPHTVVGTRQDDMHGWAVLR